MYTHQEYTKVAKLIKNRHNVESSKIAVNQAKFIFYRKSRFFKISVPGTTILVFVFTWDKQLSSHKKQTKYITPAEEGVREIKNLGRKKSFSHFSCNVIAATVV